MIMKGNAVLHFGIEQKKDIKGQNTTSNPTI